MNRDYALVDFSASVGVDNIYACMALYKRWKGLWLEVRHNNECGQWDVVSDVDGTDQAFLAVFS